MTTALAQDVGLACSRSKVRIPRQTLMARPRLIARLDEQPHARLRLVQAPAGYGKTSLLQLWSSYLRSAGVSVAWMSLDESDREPVLFVRRLLQALEEAGWGPRPELRRMLALGGAQSARAVVAAVAVEFGDPAGISIVLDDAHHLLGSEAEACLEQLVGCGPPELKLAAATREELGPAFDRQRALGEVADLGPADLGFDSMETRVFLEGLGCDDLAAPEIEALQRRTEGWPAGLKLFSLIRRGPDGSVRPVEAFTGEVRQIADYFVEDVLARQAPSLQDFMLRSSVLQWLSPDICDEVLGIRGSDELLRRCHDRGLFLSRRSEDGGVYRWHQLFAEHLRRALADRNHEMSLRLHRRAGEWLAGQGRPVEAFEHALRANAPDFAADVLDGCCDALWSEGRQATVEQLALRLPPNVLAAHPRIALLLVWRWAARWRLQEARDLLAVSQASLARLRATGREPDFLRRQTWRALHRESQIAQAAYDLPALEAHSARLIQDAAAVDDPYLLASAYNSIQYAEREQFKLTKVDQWAALARDRAAVAPQVQVFIAAITGGSYLLMGRSQEAMDFLSEALAFAKGFAGDPTPLAAAAAMPLARVLCERDEVESASALLDRYMPHALQLGFVDQLVDAWLTRARLSRLKGDAASAAAALEEAFEFGARRDLERLRVMASAERIRMLVRAGELDEAQRLLRQCGVRGEGQSRAARMRFTTQESALSQAWCRLAAARGELGEALAVARQWRSFVTTANAVQASVEWEILVAELLAMAGERSAGLRAMAQAVARAAPGRLIRPFRDEGEPVAGLLGDLGACRGLLGADGAAFLQELSARLGPDLDRAAAASKVHDEDGSALMGRLLDREIQIVGLAGAGASNREIGEKLALTEGTVKWYLQQAFDKVGVRDRVRAADKLRRLGLMN